MISFNTEEREDLLDQRWLEVLICVLGDRMGHIVTGRFKNPTSFPISPFSGKICFLAISSHISSLKTLQFN